MWPTRGLFGLTTLAILGAASDHITEIRDTSPKHKNLGRPINDPRPERKEKSKTLRAMLKSKGRK